MQDQVMNAKKHGTRAVYLGSAQMDRMVEEQSLQKNADVDLIFVTPEWISKVENIHKILELNKNNRLALVAFDEAHLYHYWQEFRPAYKELKTLKDCFLDVPFVALTATATPAVKSSILQLLRNPFITIASINRPNIHLRCEEISSDSDFSIFASRAVEIIASNCAVIYVDFINNIGPIVNQLHALGTETVAYHGEMDIKSRDVSYIKWKTDEVKVMVATTAFGMGIDKEDIRHVVRYGVPENLCSWTQELGRAGRDGKVASATVIYSASNIDHASAWLKQHHHDQEYCTRVLKDFGESWKYVLAHISCTCRRKVLLDMFGEEESSNTGSTESMTCCDVCETNASNCGEEFLDVTAELIMLVNAIDTLGLKGELKISQWIRGSNAVWTQEYDKSAPSHGNFKGHSEAWWRLFIKMCYSFGYVQRETQSLIKKNGHYAILGVYKVTTKGREFTATEDNKFTIPLRLMKQCQSETKNSALPTTSGNPTKVRIGKGTPPLIIARQMMAEKENWKTLTNKSEYQYPGVYASAQLQCVYQIDNYKTLEQSAENDPHFIWNDIQLSKGKLNKDRLLEMNVGGKKEYIYYRSAPCGGVKVCNEHSCNYVAAVREKRRCQLHPSAPLNHVNDCPVEFAYLYPENSNDNRRWIIAIIRNQKEPMINLHNHAIHGPTKIAKCIQENISRAISLNSTLTPIDISQGKGLEFVPGVVDKASTHLGRIRTEVKKPN